jgi:hypothetical protein
VQANARFCMSCGTPVDDGGAQPDPRQQPQYQQGYPQQGYAPPPPAKSRRKLVIGVALAVVAFLGVVAVRPDLVSFIPGVYAARSAVTNQVGGAVESYQRRTGDKVTDAMLANPVPAGLQGWALDPLMGSDPGDRSELEPGESGSAYLYLQRTDDANAKISSIVTAFNSPTDAQTSLKGMFDTNYTPDILAQINAHDFVPPGLDGHCMAGADDGMVSSCHVLVGRTIVFTSFEPFVTQEVASQVANAFASHVKANGG